MTREFKRPLVTDAALFDNQAATDDPTERVAAAHRLATLLVRGPHAEGDTELMDRVVHLVDHEGLGVVADVWSGMPVDTLAGVLWRLYVLRTWVHRQPDQAAREFAAGRAYAPVLEALAGVADPPGPREVSDLVDTLMRGLITADVDVVIDRAAAFAHIAGVGRAQLEDGDSVSAARLVDMATGLRQAAALERTGQLH